MTNPHNRFAQHRSEETDDGWESSGTDTGDDPGTSRRGDDASKAVVTEYIEEITRSIISRNSSPDIPFNRSINPYRGCEHGCIYCYARPSHAYWDMSPGLDFESRIIVKSNAADRLRESLSKPGYQCEPITIGANTDPYQPIEKARGITREILEILLAHRHPVSIITKSTLIRRDLDLLRELARHNLVSVAVSVTTLDNELKRKLEPRASTGQQRLAVIKALSDEGIPVAMMVAPVIPCINDHEINQILSSGREAGARSAGYILLRLPLEVEEMFTDWLTVHFPDRKRKVMSIIQQCRGGKAYRSEWGIRMRGTGVFADLLNQRFKVACRQLGLKQTADRELDRTQFRASLNQLSLF